MELRQLKYFVKVAETLNFSEAAKALLITKSTLSQQIRQLEEHMDTQLFERDKHAVCLTEAGRELLPYAKQTLSAADDCFERILELQKLLRGTLNIGVTYSFSPILTETLLDFAKSYPQIKQNIHYKPMEELMQMLERNELDFVLAFKPSTRHDNIESHVLFDNHLAAIVRNGHPLANKDKITIADLERYDIALPAKGLQARNAFDRVQSRYFSQFKVRIELNEVNILLKLIKQSDLVTVLSEATTYSEEGVKAISIYFPDNEMEGCVHLRKDVYRKQSVKEFIRILSESNAVKQRVNEWLK